MARLPKLVKVSETEAVLEVDCYCGRVYTITQTLKEKLDAGQTTAVQPGDTSDPYGVPFPDVAGGDKNIL